jgi:hypothetical protein
MGGKQKSAGVQMTEASARARIDRVVVSLGKIEAVSHPAVELERELVRKYIYSSIETRMSVLSSPTADRKARIELFGHVSEGHT